MMVMLLGSGWQLLIERLRPVKKIRSKCIRKFSIWRFSNGAACALDAIVLSFVEGLASNGSRTA